MIRLPSSDSTVEAWMGSCCCRTVVGTQSHRIPFQIGTPSCSTHRSALRGVIAARFAAFCCGEPGIRSSDPVNVPVVLMARENDCGSIGSQSPISAPESTFVHKYL